jgi:hypothetical protein
LAGSPPATAPRRRTRDLSFVQPIRLMIAMMEKPRWK